MAACLLAARLQAAASTPDGDYTIKNWQAEDGLPQNSVRCLVQTRDGYLWLGTFDGLVRFDGVRFSTFTLANTPGLRSHLITALREDRHGTLWIGTETGGLSCYRQGRFSTVGGPDGVSTDTIWSLAEDSAGALWVASPDGVFRGVGPRFERLPVPDGLPQHLDYVTPGPNGQIWLYGDAGLFLLENEKLTRFPDCEAGVTALAIDRAGEVWCWVNKAGLLQIGKDGVTRHDEVAGSRLISLLWSRDGALWMGDLSRGLMRWQSGQVTTYTTADGLAANEITAIKEDREGNLWVGSNGGGLHRLRPRMVRVYSTRDGLSSDDVMSVCEGSKGQLYIGTFGGGLNVMEADHVQHYRWKDCDNVVSLCQVPNGPLWVGTYAHGLVCWHGDQVTKEPNPCGLIVRALYRDRRGRLWVGSGREGLHCLEDGQWTSYSTEKGLSHRTVTCLLEDRAGQMWIGTARGLNRLADGRFTRFGSDDGLPVDAIHGLFEDSEGTLWIGTSGGGLARYHEGRFRTVSTRHGLANDVVAQMLEDNHGYLWIGSNAGLMRVALKELNACADGRLATVQCLEYGRAEGLLKAECAGGYQPTCMKARDGTLWFTTVGGLVVVDPTRVGVNTLAPPVFIEQVVMDSQTTDLAPWNNAVPEAAGGPPDLQLPTRIHRLEFRYTVLTFTAPERARSRYLLDGWDRDWVDAGTRRTAYYTRVPPGRYRFRVTASNDSGVWNEAGASVAVVIQPSWWQTRWFEAGALLSLLGLAYGAHLLRVQQIQRARAAQAAFSRRLIVSQEQERQRIAAGLHDTIGQELLIIKNRAVLGMQAPAGSPAITEQLAEVSRAASQAIEEVREISHNLRPYQLDRLGLTRALASLVDRVAASAAIPFHSEMDPVDKLLPPEGEINLYRVVQESLNNIVKHSDAASARLLLRHRDKVLQLLIEDDGRGFDYAALAADPRRHRGYGLSSLAERVRILNGRIRCDSTPGHGTRLTVELPVPPRHETRSTEHPDR